MRTIWSIITALHPARDYEKNLSTIQHSPQTSARFSLPYGNPPRAHHHQRPPPQRAQTAGSLKDAVFLSRRKHFVQTARRGKKITGGCWLLRFIPSSRTAARLGVSVSKRFVRLAVRRNRLRRVIREEFRQQWRADLPPMDMLIALAASPADEESARRECAALLTAAAKI